MTAAITAVAVIMLALGGCRERIMGDTLDYW